MLACVMVLAGRPVFGDEVQRVPVIGYVSCVKGTPCPCHMKNDLGLDQIKENEELRTSDEIRLSSTNCSLTVIYCDGTVEEIKGPNGWKGTSHKLANTLDPANVSFGQRMGHFFELRRGMAARGAGARGETVAPTLQVICASIEPNAGNAAVGWKGLVFWSESTPSRSNQMQMLLWAHDDLVARAPLQGELINREGDLALFRARFSLPQSAAKLTHIQVGDTARRGIGNSNPLQWESVWSPAPDRKARTQIENLSKEQLGGLIAEGIVLELNNCPAAALDLYLDLQKSLPEDAAIQCTLALFFDGRGANNVAKWYLKPSPGKGN